MEIILGKNSGFCFGVRRAVDGINSDLKIYKKVNCLGEIVHNEAVIKNLEENGVTFVESIDDVEANSFLVIRAHGVDKATYKKANEKNIKLKDYTCPKVAEIHKKIEKAEEEGYQVILIGKKNHPEVIGSYGFGTHVIVIENSEDIDLLADYEKVFVIVQTTFSYDKYLQMEARLKAKYANIVCINSICKSTKLRQEECKMLASKVDFMIIVGGKSSSNTKKLYDIALSENKNTIIVQNADNIVENLSKYDIIGIMSGASTPDESVNLIIDKLNKLAGGKNEF